MKKLIAVAASALLLTGCAGVGISAKATSYGLPTNCNIKELLALDKTYEIIDQTVKGADDSRDCMVGVPDSDVGIFFGYSIRTKAQWLVVTAKLAGEGYKKWDAGIADAQVWRRETGNAESGANCSLSGYVPGVSFSMTEPWTKCDDASNKKLVGYLVSHAVQ